MNLKRRQELFLDGIESSLVMIRICYFRLHYDVLNYYQIEKNKDAPVEISILLDAWSLVDTLNRLRILISQTPGLKKNSIVVLFQKATEPIEVFRDFVQHINGEIPKAEETGKPFWGSMSWIYISPEMRTKKEVSVAVIIPGRLAKSDGYPAVNPIGKEIVPPIDHISLTASNNTIDLSDLYRTTLQFEKRFLAALHQGVNNQNLEQQKNEIVQIVLQ